MAWEAVFYTETPVPIHLPKFKTNAHTQSGQKSGSLIDPLGANELCHNISPTHVAAILEAFNLYIGGRCESAPHPIHTRCHICQKRIITIFLIDKTGCIKSISGLFLVYILLTSGFKGIFQSTPLHPIQSRPPSYNNMLIRFMGNLKFNLYFNDFYTAFHSRPRGL